MIDPGLFPMVNGLEVFVMIAVQSKRFFVLCSDRDTGRAADGFRPFILHAKGGRGGTGTGADGVRYGAPGSRIVEVRVHEDCPEGIVIVLPWELGLGRARGEMARIMAEVQGLHAARGNGKVSGKKS